ncbi:MAG: PAS domain S-box protein [Nostoc sp. DedQUE12b]|uniref:PAS domain S-box protein n=1 Tax=Nostoc sp. DedQUE12b TaxID=3075398 RepID=UPI002AD5628E|nr:PAS domain S-box protein [Nostoc sp. DedQUE12b]MDZ8086902.1 PAS domain S-box protein [Nostoc sp. DedQUE12b]
MSHPSCLTILLIDDCAEDREAYRRFLEQDSLYTYRFLEFEAGKPALKCCQQEIPDIVLLDFALPDRDGLKFIQQFRECHSNTQTAVIVLTEQGDEISAVRAMTSGVQDYLVKKKLTPEVLQGAIHHAVQRMDLIRQLEQSREQQQLIAAIALQIRQCVKLEEILRTTATEVRQFLKADRVVIYQFQPDMSGTIVAESVLPGWTVALGKQILDTCFYKGTGSDYRQGKKRAIDDIYQAGLTNCHLQLLEQFEVKANLVVPILVKERLWGLLIAHQCSASRHWQSVELDLLDQLAVQIAIAIQQGSSDEQVQAELAERQRTEAALKASEEKLKLTLSFAGIGYWELNPITNQIFASENAIRCFSSDLSSDVNWTYEKWANHLYPEDREWVEQELRQAIATQTDYAVEYRVVWQDGSIHWVSAKGRGVYDATGQLLQMLGVLMDITERKLSEEERRRTQMLQIELRLLEQILEVVLAGYWDWDIPGNQEYLSLTFKQMFGYEDHELANTPESWQRLIFPEDLPGVLQLFEQHIQSRGQIPYYNEVRYRHKDGSTVWVICSGRVIAWDRDGNPLRMIGCHVDITQRKQAEQELIHNRDLQEAIFNESADAIFLVDPQTLLTLNCNRRAVEMFEAVDKAELVNISGQTLQLRPFTASETDASVRDMQLKGVWSLEIEYVTLQGKIFWGNIAAKPITVAGRTMHLVRIADISERKEAQEALAKYAYEVEDLYNNAPCGYHSLDSEGRLLKVNETELQWLGYTREEMIGQPLVNFFTPASRLSFAQSYPRFKKQGSVKNLEFDIVCKDGTILPVLVSATAVKDAEGNYLYSRSTLFDVRERKQTAQELEESRKMLQTVLDTFPQRVFWKDRQSRFIGCNPAFIRDFQLTADEIIGKTDFELPWAKLAHLYYADDAMVMNTQTPKLGYEEPFEGDNGKQLWLRTNKVPLTNNVGEVIGILVSHEDITERKQAEAQLRQTNEQLANANMELARATRLKDEFLANMSHELRTPLNAILGMSEGLQESVFGSLNERQAKAIATIERSGRHLLELINDILDLSKIESGKLELQLSDVSVRSLCDTSLAFVKQMALKKNIRLITHISDNIASIQVDDRRLRQVLINLLSNAVKFTPERGSVTLEVRLEGQGSRGAALRLRSVTREQGSKGAGKAREVNSSLSSSSSLNLCFHITDTGIGIAPEEISKLFQPFIQLDSSLNRQYSGTGLGLALVQKIITLHGGTVLVSSEVGKGSCFTVRIPYRTSSNNVLRTQVTASLPSYPLLAENAQVLIIEDSVAAADQITRYFREMGMQPIIYSQGEGAVEEVLRVQPALIILDLQLPNLSGWEVLNQLKINPKTKDIPTIIISVMDEHSKGLAQGAFEYLVKPITRAQLQVTIEKLQHPARSDSPNLIVVPEVFLENPLILLAEDNQPNIDTMSAYLESRGYHIILANNGQQAIDLVRVQCPDLIVMDIQMPGMDGLEAIRRIRNDRQFAHIPIIALTALAMPGDRETCLAAGANEYLTKPIKLKQLVTTIQQLLGR